MLIGTRSECDRLQCQGNRDPVFNVFYHQVNNEYFHCLNRSQFGQYWKCVVEERDFFSLPDVIDVVFVKKYLNCKTVGLFIQKLLSMIILMKFRINLFCGVYLLAYLIKNRFRFKIAKSIPNTGLVLDYGQIR